MFRIAYLLDNTIPLFSVPADIHYNWMQVEIPVNTYLESHEDELMTFGCSVGRILFCLVKSFLSPSSKNEFY